MCGIAGIFNLGGQPADKDTLRAMNDRLVHRGPDGGALVTRGPVGLAHRRLSIIDLSENGRQPMCNEDGTVWLTFNGEIYNFQELRRELVRKGHRFHSQTDSEVVVHLYEEEGDRFVTHLRGMFALAIWDERSQRLLLARDRFGIKPLTTITTAKRAYSLRRSRAFWPTQGSIRPSRPRPSGISSFTATFQTRTAFTATCANCQPGTCCR